MVTPTSDLCTGLIAQFREVHGQLNWSLELYLRRLMDKRFGWQA